MSDSKISDKEIINSFFHILPYLKLFFEDDVSYAIMDTEKYLISVNGRELVFNVSAGDPIPEGGAAREALRTGTPIIKNVPAEIYGTPFRSYAIPLKENNELVGIFVLGKSFARKNEVQTITKNVSSAIHQTSDAIEDLVAGVKKITETNSELMSSTLEANEKTKDAYKIVEFVQQISTQTYLLGINASIDASRAGKFGQSFDVVAQEIGRLSESTKESITKIDTLLSCLASSIGLVTKGLTESTGVYLKQTKDLDEIAAAISDLKDTCTKLEKLSESI